MATRTPTRGRSSLHASAVTADLIFILSRSRALRYVGLPLSSWSNNGHSTRYATTLCVCFPRSFFPCVDMPVPFLIHPLVTLSHFLS
jgi:hypothetical protein